MLFVDYFCSCGLAICRISCCFPMQPIRYTDELFSMKQVRWVLHNPRLTEPSAQSHWPAGEAQRLLPTHISKTKDRIDMREAVLEISLRYAPGAVLKVWKLCHVPAQGQNYQHQRYELSMLSIRAVVSVAFIISNMILERKLIMIWQRWIIIVDLILITT